MKNTSSLVEVGKGRPRPGQIEELLAAYDSSGLTQREFVRQSGVTLSSFTYWLRRRRQRNQAATAPAWVPVEVQNEAQARGSYYLQWPDGASLRIPCGFNPAEVRTLLQAVQACSR